MGHSLMKILFFCIKWYEAYHIYKGWLEFYDWLFETAPEVARCIKKSRAEKEAARYLEKWYGGRGKKAAEILGGEKYFKKLSNKK